MTPDGPLGSTKLNYYRKKAFLKKGRQPRFAQYGTSPSHFVANMQAVTIRLHLRLHLFMITNLEPQNHMILTGDHLKPIDDRLITDNSLPLKTD